MRIDLAGFTRGSTHIDHRAFLNFCREMDRLGYDGIWFNELHFLQPASPYPSTLLLASAILARTERMRVGTSIAVLPLYHPFLLAEQVAQLHMQSQGRFDFGIGRGTYPATLGALGIPAEETRPRFAQSLALMMSAWKQPTRVPEGGIWPVSTASVGPLLPEGETVPVYIAGSTRETVECAAEQGFPLLLSLEPSEIRQLRVHDEITGRNCNRYPSDFSLSRFVMIAESRNSALALVEELLPRLFERRLYHARVNGRPVETVMPIDRDEFLANQMIAGDPDDCIRQIRALRDATGIESIRLNFNCNGEIPEDRAEDMARLFGETALSCLQALPVTPPETELVR